ncbi:MAG: signal peptide peptidase SppA [Candidatus Anammoxibacter sp.]
MSDDSYRDNTNMNRDNLPIKNNKNRSAIFWIFVGFGSFFLLSGITLVLLVVGAIFLGRTMIQTDGARQQNALQEVVVAGTGEDKIVMIPINGVISDKSTDNIFLNVPGMVHVIKKSLEQVAADSDVKAVIFTVDSPGGGITASDIIYNNIKRFKEATGKPVVVYMQNVAASGGYYVSIAADKIIAHPTTITGSIGVIMPIINVSKLIDKYGIEETSIKSGKMKDIGSPLKEMLPEEKEVLSEIVDEMYMRFITLISKERGLPIDQVRILADGRIFTGKQAVNNGLIDQVGYLEDAIDIAKDLAGLKEAKIIKYERKLSVGDFLKVMASKMLTKPEITINLDDFPIKHISKPMYLWSGG